MAHSTTHTHHRRRPRRVRAPSERAQGLEPEFTAQPHPLSEELGLVVHDEDALSIAPEDLGSHFLSEAVEQGGRGGHEHFDLELALLEAEVEADDAPQSEAEFAAWAKMIERATKDVRVLHQVTAEEPEPELTERDLRESVPSGPVRLDESIVREVSLLDREGVGLDETVTPVVDIDDTGRHARLTSRGALGEQVDDRPVRKRAADGGKRIGRAAKQRIGAAAGRIRSIARRIAKRG